MSDGLMFTASFLGTLAAVGGLIGVAWRRFRGVSHLLDDLLGEPPRPGVAHVPGVLERLSATELALRDVQGELERLRSRAGTVGCRLLSDDGK